MTSAESLRKKFRFRVFGGQFMAALDVWVEADGFRRKTVFLVDSGAVRTFVPKGSLIGFPGLDSIKPIQTAIVDANGKRMVARPVSATLKVDGLTPVQDEILVADDLPFGLLGLSSWFELNKVIFLNKKSSDTRDRTFWVKSNA